MAATRDLPKTIPGLVLRLVGLVPHFGTSLSLAPSNHFRTEATSFFHHDNVADRGLNEILFAFDVTLNSSSIV